MAGNLWDARAYDAEFGFVARYGDDVLGLIDVQPGERILDLGCGTGRHAGQLARLGAHVVGVDADGEMLAMARRDHPGIDFVAADATHFGLRELGVGEPFAACFSNAALHWMTPQDAVLENVRSVLARSGRFVAEMGGAGNIRALDEALREALAALGLADAPVADNFFPTVGQEAALLEDAGFGVELMTWFRRPTLLAEGTTAADWTKHFRSATWAAVPPGRHRELAEEVDARAAALGLLSEGRWSADYCRLRFVAIAV